MFGIRLLLYSKMRSLKVVDRIPKVVELVETDEDTLTKRGMALSIGLLIQIAETWNSR